MILAVCWLLLLLPSLSLVAISIRSLSISIYTHTCSNLGFTGLIKCTYEYNSSSALYSRSRLKWSTLECNCFCVMCCEVLFLFLLFTCCIFICFAFIFVPISVSDSQFNDVYWLNRVNCILYMPFFLSDNWHKTDLHHIISTCIFLYHVNYNTEIENENCMYVFDGNASTKHGDWRCFYTRTHLFTNIFKPHHIARFSMIWSVRPSQYTPYYIFLPVRLLVVHHHHNNRNHDSRSCK